MKKAAHFEEGMVGGQRLKSAYDIQMVKNPRPKDAALTEPPIGGPDPTPKGAGL